MVQPTQPQLAAPLAHRRVASARLRLWRQEAQRRLLLAALVAAGLAAVLLPLLRMDVLPRTWDRPLAGLALALGLAALSWIAAHRPGRLATARRLDDLGGGSDALATALWLAQQERRDAWSQVQAQAAETFAARVDVRALLPWRWPAQLRWLPLAAGALALALAAPLTWLLPWTLPGPSDQLLAGLTPRLPPGPHAFASAAEVLGADAVALLHTDLRLLDALEAQVHKPETRQWLHEVRDVFGKVADGQIDKRQALELLADLEKRRPHDPEADEAPRPPSGEPARDAAEAQQQRDLAVRNAVLDAARAAAGAAPKGAEADAIKKATEQKDLDALAKIAEQLADKNLSDKELEKWVKAVEKFASALKDRKVPEKFKELADRISRLQQKRAENGGLGRSDQERLQSARHELEQLRKTEGDPQAAQHQVQRLERGARAAADELRRQQGSRLGQKGAENKEQTAQALKNQMRAAADELRRESHSEQARQAERIGQARMRDVREALERAGERNAGKESFEQRAAGQEGQKGHGNGDKSRLGQKPAGGKDGEQPGQGEHAQGGQPQPGQDKPFKLGQGRLGNHSRMEELRQEAAQAGRGGKSGQKAGGQQEPGDGQGDGPGSDEQNGKERRLAGGKREKLQGEEGKGPDTKKVFVDAARKGFARQGWREVYVEYSEVAEEMLDKEQLPAGRRAVVRRYFELIRPR